MVNHSGIDLSFFEDVAEAELGAYVYLLVDPRDDIVFYVGKAGGKDAQGNDRPNDHLQETFEAFNVGQKLSAKQQRILDIWNAGHRRPKLKILRRQLRDSHEAFEVEAAAIDLFRLAGITLTNSQGGLGQVRGLLNEEGLASLRAAPVNPSRPIANVWLFNIGKEHDARKDLFETVRGHWVIAKPTAPSLAVGLVRGRSYIACDVIAWQESPDKSGKRLRKYFDGKIATHEDARDLLYKKYDRILDQCPAWRYGMPLCVRFDGQGSANVIYGGARDISL